MSARGVFQYRDAKARDEIDAVGEASDGRWVVVMRDGMIDGD